MNFRSSAGGSENAEIILNLNVLDGFSGLFDLTPKIKDQICDIRVIWRKPSKLLGVSQRLGKISGIAIKADESNERVAIIGMLREVLFQNADCIVGTA